MIQFLHDVRVWLWLQSPDVLLFVGAVLGVVSFVVVVETVAAFRASRSRA